MHSLPPEEAGWELMGGPDHPGVQGLEPAWSYCLGWGGGQAVMPNANDERSQGGRTFALQIPLCSGGEVRLSSSKSWETVASTPFPP